MPDREKVRRQFEEFAAITEPGMPQCVTISAETVRDVLALLKEQEAMPSYNDAVDTIKYQSKVIGFACETLAGYESEEPCNTLFYIKEQRQKCDERCCNDKTPDEWCWRRYFALMAKEDSDA